MAILEVPAQDFASWRTAARKLIRQGATPLEVHWLDGTSDAAQGLLAGLEAAPPEDDASKATTTTKVPREFLSLAETVSCFRDPQRWNLLYELLWRLSHGEPHLLDDPADPLVRKLRVMEKAVRRDAHKMHAFVRFREAADGAMVAFHKPDHHIVRREADFFVRRFGAMNWAILTPDECAYWDQKQLRFGPGLPRESAPSEDEVEDLWLTYYGSIFNPARANLTAMTAEMPVKHWSTLPESKLINGLLRTAGDRMYEMIRKQPSSAASFVPSDTTSLKVLQQAACNCQGCELYEHATQTVFGEGLRKARLMLVGEQPGDQEDQQGAPFVGPAGKVLNEALEAAGIDRADAYVTNAVKHFRFEERGKRRIHKKPDGRHISACKPWLEAEIALIKPKVIVCLGATAAQSLVGRDVRIMQDRGKWMDSLHAPNLMVTVHPSALLRLPPGMSYEEEFTKFVRDLRLATEEVNAPLSNA
ncbi:uracil-DNA glycosylase [Bryobacterales bacterium F-183]|nr:uracil-DNA glycosylase [Bryobacterales bacterium F-183]